MTTNTVSLMENYLQEIKNAGFIKNPVQILARDQSKLLKIVTPIVKIFNPKFDSYITTINHNIYVPLNFYNPQADAGRILSVVSHECRHIMDLEDLSMPLYVLLYGFPQILFPVALLAILIVTLFSSWTFLFALIFLLPLPAYGRYIFELRAYRTRQLLERNFGSAVGVKQAEDDCVEQLSKQWYYFTWPFPSMIRKALLDESYHAEAFYAHLSQFALANNVRFP